MPAKIPACIDCKYFSQDVISFSYISPKCKHPSSKITTFDKVHGEVEEFNSCRMSRERGECGTYGKHFDEPFLSKILKTIFGTIA